MKLNTCSQKHKINNIIHEKVKISTFYHLILFAYLFT